MPPRDRGLVRFSAKIAAGALSAVLTWSAAHAFDAARWDQSVLRVVTFQVQADGKSAPAGFGTGFVIDREYVLTNHHVIDDAAITRRNNKAAYGVVDGSLQNVRPAQLIWSSTELDLAIIRVPGLTRPSLTLSGGVMLDYPRKAETVWTIGFPGIVSDVLKSLEALHVQSTVTKGVVAKTAVGNSQGGRDKVRPIIQHSASFNRGNSGGPLLDDCGVVVGVNTFSPVAVLEVTKHQGKDVAIGKPNTGVFFSPHIGNFVAAHRAAPELKAVNIRVTSAQCATAMGETGRLPVWLYPVIGLVALFGLSGTVLALRKGTTREVVRMVESYSAYVKRKGKPPSEESMQPRPVTSPPDISAAGASAPRAASRAAGWKLSGQSTGGKAIALALTAAALAEATARKEGGLVLGRSASLADTVVDDPSVSRRHAKLYATDGGLAVEDLKSAYGTQVNGHKLEAFQAVELKAGDKLTLGAVELVVAGGG